MSETRVLYNPVDGDDPDQVEVTYRAVVFKLEPNKRNEIVVPDLPSFESVNVHMIVGHIMERHGHRGVTVLTDNETANKALVQAAEEQYLTWLWERYEDDERIFKTVNLRRSGFTGAGA